MGTYDVSLRPAREVDSVPIAQLWTEAYVRAGLVPHAEPFTVRKVHDALDQAEVFVADQEGQVVGVVVLAAHGTALASITESSAEEQVCLLAVSAAARRSGVGRALMDVCAARAGKRDCAALVLWTRPPQHAAHHLYEALGYHRAPSRDCAPGGHPRLAYRLALSWT